MGLEKPVSHEKEKKAQIYKMLSQWIPLLWSNSESILISWRTLLVMLLVFRSEGSMLKNTCEKKGGKIWKDSHKDIEG